jgi:hypothetical protein
VWRGWYHAGSTKTDARISGMCSVGTKIDVRVLFAIFYLLIGTVFYMQVEKLLVSEHVAVSAICSSAYIPPIVVHLLPDAL